MILLLFIKCQRRLGHLPWCCVRWIGCRVQVEDIVGELRFFISSSFPYPFYQVNLSLRCFYFFFIWLLHNFLGGHFFFCVMFCWGFPFYMVLLRRLETHSGILASHCWLRRFFRFLAMLAFCDLMFALCLGRFFAYLFFSTMTPQVCLIPRNLSTLQIPNGRLQRHGWRMINLVRLHHSGLSCLTAFSMRIA